MVKAEWFSKEDTCRFIQLFACAIIITNKLAVVGLTFLIIVVILFSQKDKAEALSFYIVKIKSFVDTYDRTMLQVWEHKWKTFKKKKKGKWKKNTGVTFRIIVLCMFSVRKRIFQWDVIIWIHLIKFPFQKILVEVLKEAKVKLFFFFFQKRNMKVVNVRIYTLAHTSCQLDNI